LDEKLDICIDRGAIKRLERDILEPEAEIIDADGMIVCPAFVDIHTHLRDPGQTYKEDLESGSKSAVAGGYTTLVCMPNTSPPIDTPHTAEYVIRKACSIGLCRVLPAGSITKGRKGKELVDFWALKEVGCVAFTDDGSPLMDSTLMRKALEISSELRVPIMNHCEDDSLASGSVNEGNVSALLGLSTRPPEAEDILNARDCILAYYTGGHVHIQHLTTELGVEIVREFKAKGARISCEVNPNHLIFTEEELLNSGANARVNPPLRRETDRQKLLEALADGTIDCVATDHAPHHSSEKGIIEGAMPGIIGLQTALPILLQLVKEGRITLLRLVELMSTKPSEIINLDRGNLRVGSAADITIFDPDMEWVLNEETNLSKSRNTPLWNRKLKGRVIYTIKEGRVVYKL
jgi:dihydroorotase